MRIGFAFPGSCGLLAVLSMLGGACSHDWGMLDAQPGADSGSGAASGAGSGSSTGGASGAGGAGAAGSGAGSTGSTGSTGAGGGSACMPGYLGPASPCGGVTSTFDDQAQFDAGWTDATGANDAMVLMGEVELHMGTLAFNEYMQSKQALVFEDCAVWVAIFDATADPSFTTRIGLSVNDAPTYYSLGLHGSELEARAAATVVQTIPYDASAMRYVRLREEGGAAHFDYSADGRCWLEFKASPGAIQPPAHVRVGLTRVSGTTGPDGVATFDDFGVTP